jgi:hypothetical protein
VALAALVILIIVFYTESQIRSISQNIIEKKINEVNVLASRASLRLSDAGTVMTITGSLPQITSRLNVSMMIDNSHGVPQNAKTGKRFVARIILKEYSNFETASRSKECRDQSRHPIQGVSQLRSEEN